MKAQDFIAEWEKENNPFYPNNMKWDRATVYRFAKAFDNKYTLKEKKIEVLTIKCSDLEKFNDEVQEMLNNGYEILGSAIITNSSNNFKSFYQQFIRKL